MRDVDTLKGLHGVKTLGSAKKRSLPNVKSSAYLELYMMDKEKERLDKECERLELRLAQIKTRLGEISHHRRRTAKMAAEPEAKAPEEGGRRDWKRMPLNY